MALSRLAKEELPAYQADDVPLTARRLKDLKKVSAATSPKGKVVMKPQLF